MSNVTAVLEMEPTTSEIIEMFYQLSFFLIGFPINVVAFRRTTKNIREGGVESRLVKLSRQLLVAHMMVLFVYGIWRSYWFYNIVWIQGNFLCKVFSFFCALPFHLWSNLVAAIAVDMLCCITSPLSSYRTGANRVNWLIGIAWTCALLCSLPMVVIRGTIKISTQDQGDFEQCYPLVDYYSKELLIAFNIFHVVTSFYIPLMIIVVCYSLIGLSLKKQMAERRLLQDGGTTPKQTSTKARFLRASLAIIATFFFTWLPYQILAFLRVVCDEDDTCQAITSKLNWLQAIIIASTCINPFLYRFRSADRTRCSHNGSTLESGVAGTSRSALRSSTSQQRKPIMYNSIDTGSRLLCDTGRSPRRSTCPAKRLNRPHIIVQAAKSLTPMEGDGGAVQL